MQVRMKVDHVSGEILAWETLCFAFYNIFGKAVISSWNLLKKQEFHNFQVTSLLLILKICQTSFLMPFLINFLGWIFQTKIEKSLEVISENVIWNMNVFLFCNVCFMALIAKILFQVLLLVVRDLYRFYTETKIKSKLCFLHNLWVQVSFTCNFLAKFVFLFF
jgi:hypothetical protein